MFSQTGKEEGGFQRNNKKSFKKKDNPAQNSQDLYGVVRIWEPFSAYQL